MRGFFDRLRELVRDLLASLRMLFVGRTAPALAGASVASPAPAAPAELREGFLDRALRETELLARYPHYAGIVARMVPIETTNVTAMAIGLRRRFDPGSPLSLLVNPAYFEERPEERLPVLLHEIQHVVLGHLHDELLHRVRYPHLVELAMEISADEPIEALLGDHGFSVERFARYGIAPGQSTHERYALLAEAYERGELPADVLGQRPLRDTHRTGDPRCTTLGDLIDARSDGATDRVWARRRPGLGAPSTRAQLDAMKAEIARHLRGERGGGGAASARGVAQPKELGRVLDARAGGERLAWQRIVPRMFPPTRAVFPDARRPNRRFPDRVGEVPGRVRRTPPPSLLVAIDTSASMTVDVLGRIADELERLGRVARIQVVEADAAVHRSYRLRARPRKLVGGGDTDFAPALAEAERHRDLDGVVYFTDGRGPMPEARPRVPMLWVLTHDEPFEAPMGTVIRLPSITRR
ncbi:MAG: hypothetical protein K1X94_17900 [Sandaracinaceae bacterium]|nr:hypothetical protein [Sandaracinaceae bacterium]